MRVLGGPWKGQWRAHPYPIIRRDIATVGRQEAANRGLTPCLSSKPNSSLYSWNKHDRPG